MAKAGAAAWVTEFEQLSDKSQSGIPFVFQKPGQSPDSPHVVIGFAVHGNEFGTLPAALRLARELADGLFTTECTVSLFLGNPEAALKDERFLEEDLNRVFVFDQAPTSLEGRRALELCPLMDSADLFLDLHQTQTATEEAFWTLPWEGELGLWARAISGAKVGLTRRAGGVFSVGRCCADEYVRARGAVGLTLEVGERGYDPAQESRAYQAATRAIELGSRVFARGESLALCAEERPKITWFETAQVFTDQSQSYELRPGLFNWSRVEKGEPLHAPGSPDIAAEVSGRVLFPKYASPTQPVPPELFRLGVQVDDPETHFSKA